MDVSGTEQRKMASIRQPSLPRNRLILFDRFGDGLAVKFVLERKSFDDPRCGISANQIIADREGVISQIELLP